MRGVGRQEPNDPTRQAAFAARPREGRRERRHDFPFPLSPTPVVRQLKAGPPEHGGGRPLDVAPEAGRPALSVRASPKPVRARMISAAISASPIRFEVFSQTMPEGGRGSGTHAGLPLRCVFT